MEEQVKTTALKEEEFNKHIDFNVWKKLFAYVMRYKGMILIVALSMIVVAAIDIIYPQITRYAIDNIIADNDPNSLSKLPLFALFYLAMIVIQGALVLCFCLVSGKLEMKVAFDIRQDAFKRLQQLSFSYYDKTAVGNIMTRMVSDIPRLSEMLAWSFTDIFWAGAFAIGCLITMLMMNWKLGLVVLIVVPPIAVVCGYFQKKILK